MKTITIVADDKVGLLADISYILAKTKINIESVNVDVVAGKAIITIGIHDPVKSKVAVEAAGYKVEDPNTIVIKIKDEPGEFDRVKAVVAKEGVKIEKSNLLSNDGKIAVMSVTVDKPKRANVVLGPYMVANEPG
jgi:hypothetical protein